MQSPDTLPPQNIEAEQCVLSCVLLDGRVLHEVQSIVAAKDFYRPEHREVFLAMGELARAGTPVDAITLHDHLETIGRYDALGGDAFLGDLTAAAPHSGNAAHYAGIVRSKALLRKTLEACLDGITAIYAARNETELTAEQVVAGVEQRILDAGADRCLSDTRPIAAAAAESLDRLFAREQGGQGGLGTGFDRLDVLLDGLHGKQLILIAGRPGLGKTALALDIAAHVAIDLGKAVHFCSMEMAAGELADRVLAARASVPGMAMRTGKNVGRAGWDRLTGVMGELAGVRWNVEDAAVRTVEQVAASARRAKAAGNLDLLVLDYLQLIEGEAGKGRPASRQEQVATISRRLKQLAKDLDVPVLALSQLNREVEQRAGQKPQLKDLRESGALEQDADVVLMIHKPQADDGPAAPDAVQSVEVEILVRKNRSGPTGEITVLYEPEYPRFRPARFRPPAGAF